jgi:hypothetical protein
LWKIKEALIKNNEKQRPKTDTYGKAKRDTKGHETIPEIPARRCLPVR